MKRSVPTRSEIWTDRTLAKYRQFLNLLVKPDGSDLAHCEYFYPWHTDWEKRIASPYVLFDDALSRFDLSAPLHVSSYRREEGMPDKWRRSDATVRRLESMLFRDRTDRRLRTSELGYGHAKLRLPGTDDDLANLRTELLALFDSRATTGSPVDAPRSGSSGSTRGGGCG